MIAVKYLETSSLSIREGDENFTCDHEFAELEPACCSGRDSQGNVDCGCYGQDSVYCPDCELDDFEAEAVFERLTVEPDYE